ncbi:putative UDP-glucose,sterol transferase [Aspergillus undulatus]|uniref:putative UDP-glucose,sterol transferase n=1 Tax=Aspergillus undulatus TaxID=1810928 RepID=UPI003CCDDD99
MPQQRAVTISSEDWTHASYSSGRAAHKLEGHGHDTGVRVLEDGRLNINFTPSKPWLQRIARHTEDHPYPRGPVDRKPSVSFSQNEEEQYPLRLNIVIQVVGSRGDIQPFLAIGKQLKSHGHRVRLATHLSFREPVENEGLEYFNIGGDPAELMAFMVKNPGLMPDMRTIRSGAIRLRRKEMKSIFSGCWRSCFEIGDGTGIEHHVAEDPWNEDVDYRNLPFVADVIIANPPSFAHMSCAEKLGVPLNMMFTMPWSATQAFAHPLANIQSQNTKPSVANFASYAIVEIMMWEGLGDLINRFRKRELGLDPLDAIRAPSIAHRLQIPYTYLWSPALLEKPLDWGTNIDVVGFSHLPQAQDYTPPDDLQRFLDAGPPPVYIGFGSIVVDDSAALTKIVFDAVQKTGQRAVVSKGWGNIGADQADSDSIIMIDKCPHDWLFQHVSAVVHHGGAGTTAAGLALGKPTIIIPFFGDQTFWGSIVSRAGAGPDPIPWKRLKAEKLAEAIQIALKDETKKTAAGIGESMQQEEGVRNAVCSFYRHLDSESLQCSLCPNRPAVWWVKHSHIKLSAFAATVLVETGLVKPHNLVLYRAKEYDTSRDPRGPLSAGAEVLYGVVTDFVAAMAEIPSDVAEVIRGTHRSHRRPRSSKHLKHGQKQRAPSPVRRWKKEHYALQNLDSGVGSSTESTRRSSDREGSSADTGKTPDMSHADGDDDENEEGESDSGSISASSATISSSATSSAASSYASAREETTDDNPSKLSQARPEIAAQPAGKHGAGDKEGDKETQSVSDSAMSRTPTNENITDDMQTLSLEDTLRCQQSREKSAQPKEILTDARYHVSRAGKHLLNWALLLPADLTLSFSKGFHNAPKLYHDPMVQETPTVRGLRGGLRAAGTEFTQEFYQGLTGVVTQPRHGRKESGAKGMLKGVGKGVGGVLLKPTAGLWGLVGYPLEGLHKSLRNSLSRSKIRDILSSRIAQGLGEMVAATPEERAAVIRRWNEMQKDEGNSDGETAVNGLA